MIANDFIYYRPDTLHDLTEATTRADAGFMFYGGGSEIITMARAASIAPSAVIDLKAIPEMREMKLSDGKLTIGACVTLSEIAEANQFPLLCATVKRIADHTNQCRITLGGNIAGTIAYREAALPLLLADASVTLWRNGETRVLPFRQAFQKRVMRATDEAILHFQIEEKYLRMPWSHAKRTRGEKIDYPVVTLAALKAPDGLRFALSGVLSDPFRDPSLERVFSDTSKPAAVRAKAIVENLPEPPISDLLAKADWRAFQTRRALEEAIVRLEGMSC